MTVELRAALSGRYVIERELGRGGSAQVYLARDVKHGRRVALKVVTADVANTLIADRFLREIRTTAGLSHPHILPLFDSGIADGVLYYSMPYVPGETLRHRLNREPLLPAETAIHITGQLADAVAFAHAAGVVHRDLKPENILLGPGEHVWVADFGLSRALSTATNERLSGAGFALGSPGYMSPEQASGTPDVDGRSDIYSLGCVAFELLTGTPPYSEKSVATLLRQHIVAPPPSARERNPAVSEAMDAALRRAMAKRPEDRFADAREFVRALEGKAAGAVHVQPAARGRPARHRVLWYALPAAAAAVAVLVMTMPDPINPIARFRGAAAQLDTTRYALLPFSGAESAAVQYAQQRMRQALEYWDGITLVDAISVTDAVDRRGVDTRLDRQRIAADVGAGRFVGGSISADGDTLEVSAAVYDASNAARALANKTVRFHKHESDVGAYFNRLADGLLFGDAPAPPRSHETESRAALNSYLAGHAAIEDWDLERADTLFAEATTLDPAYGRGLFWLAHVRMWRALRHPSWVQPAERAAALVHELPPREQALLGALVAMGRGDYPDACNRYRTLLAQDERDFRAMYGLAECLHRDSLVVPDPVNPGRSSFRSSGHQAMQLYKRTFELIPATHRAFSAGRFRRLRNEIFFTAPSVTRPGHNVAGEQFVASPTWEADSLAFYPFPVTQLVGVAWKASTSTATRKMRRLFFDVTTVWVTEYPESADALEARAIAMELMDDARALATLQQARALAATPEQRLNLQISEFWLHVKRALPNGSAELRGARLLADSILSENPAQPNTANRMAAVAAATGRSARSAQLARTGANTRARPGVAQHAAALVAFAAAGGPADSIGTVERTTERAITNLLDDDEAAAVRREFSCRAASLAFAVHRMAITSTAHCAHNDLVGAFVAFARGDHLAARSMLDSMQHRRAAMPPSDISFETLTPEAWLLLNMNEPEAARDRLQPALQAIQFMEPGVLDHAAASGTLARALLLRAQIAHVLDDHASARIWATAFLELWRNADEPLQPLRRQAAQLAGRNPR